MKKLFGALIVALVAACAVNAAPLGFGELSKNLNALSTTKAEAAAGTLADGRELLPILWKYAYDEPTLEGKVKGFSVKLTSINPVTNEYEFVQDVIFKSGIALADQRAKVRVTQTESGFSVETLGMTSFTVNGKGERIGEVIEIGKKGQNQNSKNIAGDFEKFAKELSADDYQKWSDAAYNSLTVQTAAADSATNKLKAKKWFSTYPLEGKKTSGKIFVTSVDESKREGYAYKVSGVANVTQKHDIHVEFHTNDDKYIDVKATESVNISGTAVTVSYTPDYESYYGVSSVVIEE